VLFSLMAAATVAAHGESFRKILIAIAGSSGVIALYAVAQYAGLDPLLSQHLYTFSYHGELLRVPGTLGHAVYLGSFLAAAIPIVVGLGAEACGIRKVVFGGIAGLSLVATVASGSRSAVLALAAGAVVSLPVFRRIRWRNFLSALAACTALAAGLLIVAALHSGFRWQLERWREDLYGGPRLLVWRESLDLVAARPVAGSGPETFGNEFRRRQSAALSRAYPEFLQESPHNLLLDGAITQGVSFFPIAAGMVYLALAGGRKRDTMPTACLRASMIAAFVSLQFLTVTISGALMLYGAMALLVASQTPVGVWAYRPPAWFVKVAACGLALFLTAAGAAYLRKEMAYAGVANTAKTDRFEDMAQAYRTAADSWFPAPGDDLWCSRQFAAKARHSDGPTAARAWALAAEASATAENTSDNQADAAYQSALIAIGTNHAEKAEPALRRAIEYAPNWYKPHLLLAQLLHFTGLVAGSKTEAQRALDLAGSMRPSVERALSTIQIP
jgi:O-antigen ligase